MTQTQQLPPRLAEVVDDLAQTPRELLVEALLDYADRVPPLPEGMDRGQLEQVHECQTPFFVAAEVDEQGRVRLYFDAPPEAPTTRGFAGILSEGLSGVSVEEVLSTPGDFYVATGLGAAISPLRLRGMAAILARVKRQVREAAANGTVGTGADATPNRGGSGHNHG
jgi:cysteine desulfuration protein SufE